MGNPLFKNQKSENFALQIVIFYENHDFPPSVANATATPHFLRK